MTAVAKTDARITQTHINSCILNDAPPIDLLLPSHTLDASLRAPDEKKSLK